MKRFLWLKVNESLEWILTSPKTNVKSYEYLLYLWLKQDHCIQNFPFVYFPFIMLQSMSTLLLLIIYLTEHARAQNESESEKVFYFQEIRLVVGKFEMYKTEQEYHLFFYRSHK